MNKAFKGFFEAILGFEISKISCVPLKFKMFALQIAWNVYFLFNVKTENFILK